MHCKLIVNITNMKYVTFTKSTCTWTTCIYFLLYVYTFSLVRMCWWKNWPHNFHDNRMNNFFGILIYCFCFYDASLSCFITPYNSDSTTPFFYLDFSCRSCTTAQYGNYMYTIKYQMNLQQKGTLLILINESFRFLNTSVIHTLCDIQLFIVTLSRL